MAMKQKHLVGLEHETLRNVPLCGLWLVRRWRQYRLTLWTLLPLWEIQKKYGQLLYVGRL